MSAAWPKCWAWRTSRPWRWGVRRSRSQPRHPVCGEPRVRRRADRPLGAQQLARPRIVVRNALELSLQLEICGRNPVLSGLSAARTASALRIARIPHRRAERVGIVRSRVHRRNGSRAGSSPCAVGRYRLSTTRRHGRGLLRYRLPPCEGVVSARPCRIPDGQGWRCAPHARSPDRAQRVRLQPASAAVGRHVRVVDGVLDIRARVRGGRGRETSDAPRGD